MNSGCSVSEKFEGLAQRAEFINRQYTDIFITNVLALKNIMDSQGYDSIRQIKNDSNFVPIHVGTPFERYNEVGTLEGEVRSILNDSLYPTTVGISGKSLCDQVLCPAIAEAIKAIENLGMEPIILLHSESSEGGVANKQRLELTARRMGSDYGTSKVELLEGANSTLEPVSMDYLLNRNL